ncbi:MAG: type IV pilus assembly protein PilM [Desulfobacteraceae bacterium]|nr:type IV pilus assembly protein PilM [Desulfobacteraceae bacterium]
MGIALPDFASRLALSFGKKEKLCVGLDIGSHAVKVCELADTGKGYRLLSLGSARLPEGAVEDGALQDPEAVGTVIAALLKNLKIKEKKVGISISGYSVIVKKINLSVMSQEAMANHIQAEAEQYIPFDIEDVYLDFQNLNTNHQDEERTDVMLVAAKKEVVDGYLGMLRSLGLKPVLVDVDAFALENAYAANFGLGENVALIDIGASKMNINIISGGSSVFARDVVLGSRQLTEQIQSRFGVEPEEAEELKIGIVSAGERKEQLTEILIGTCSQWVGEIRKALDFYYTNHPEEPLVKLVLSGGGARIRGLDQVLANELELPVEIFNPFSKMQIDQARMDADYLAYMAPEMTLAAGLASRPAEL